MLARTLAIALALSLAGNAGLGWYAVHQRDRARDASLALAGAVADAKACSDAVESLQTMARQRADAAKAERDAAVLSASKLQQRAGKTLAQKPVPAGDWTALQDVGRSWLRERSQ